jgi:hypothetical protein
MPPYHVRPWRIVVKLVSTTKSIGWTHHLDGCVSCRVGAGPAPRAPALQLDATHPHQRIITNTGVVMVVVVTAISILLRRVNLHLMSGWCSTAIPRRQQPHFSFCPGNTQEPAAWQPANYRLLKPHPKLTNGRFRDGIQRTFTGSTQ